MIRKPGYGEDMIEEGTTMARAIDDRYLAHKRNPDNEVECRDHHARAVASCGAFLAASGCEHHGPKERIDFDPMIRREDFHASFTAAKHAALPVVTQEREAVIHSGTLLAGRAVEEDPILTNHPGLSGSRGISQEFLPYAMVRSRDFPMLTT